MKITPLRAIRLKCLDCYGHQIKDIKACPSLNCPLWAFRLGKHPFHKKNQNNPLFSAEKFKGLENRTTSEVLDILKNEGESD